MNSKYLKVLQELGAVRVDGLEIRMNGTVQRVIKAPKVNLPSCGIFEKKYAIYVCEEGQVWVINLVARTCLGPWVIFDWSKQEGLPTEQELPESALRLLVPNKLGEEIDTFGLIGRAAFPYWPFKVFQPTN